MTGGIYRLGSGRPVTHIRDLIRVCDDNLFRFLRSQIFKFFQHLFCGPQIQRCLIIRIAESFPVMMILR